MGARPGRSGPGRALSTPPAGAHIWSASTTGAGGTTLTWTPQAGNWRIVLMNADGATGVTSDVSVGARVPHLLTIAIAVLAGGVLLLLLSGGGLYLAVRRRG